MTECNCEGPSECGHEPHATDGLCEECGKPYTHEPVKERLDTRLLELNRRSGNSKDAQFIPLVMTDDRRQEERRDA